MRGFLFGASLSIAFIVGCVARPFVVPAANAQQAASAQKWEYFCLEGYETTGIMQKANKAGREGWDLVAASPPTGRSMDAALWCFKRPL